MPINIFHSLIEGLKELETHLFLTHDDCTVASQTECRFRALQGPLKLYCIRIRAAALRTPNKLIMHTEISGQPESTLIFVIFMLNTLHNSGHPVSTLI